MAIVWAPATCITIIWNTPRYVSIIVDAVKLTCSPKTVCSHTEQQYNYPKVLFTHSPFPTAFSRAKRSTRSNKLFAALPYSFPDQFLPPPSEPVDSHFGAELATRFIPCFAFTHPADDPFWRESHNPFARYYDAASNRPSQSTPHLSRQERHPFRIVGYMKILFCFRSLLNIHGDIDTKKGRHLPTQRRHSWTVAGFAHIDYSQFAYHPSKYSSLVPLRRPSFCATPSLFLFTRSGRSRVRRRRPDPPTLHLPCAPQRHPRKIPVVDHGNGTIHGEWMCIVVYLTKEEVPGCQGFWDSSPAKRGLHQRRRRRQRCLHRLHLVGLEPAVEIFGQESLKS